MKNAFYLTIILLLVNLLCNQAKAQPLDTNVNYAQCSEDKNMIIGETTLEKLEQNEEFWSKYLANYANCIIDEEKTNQISNALTNRKIHIITVIGTWCSDTKEHLPVFQKIIDNIKGNNITIKYIGVNRDKLAEKTDISSLNIEFVPTFIFYEGSKELGRIVESPQTTLEEDIFNIVNNK